MRKSKAIIVLLFLLISCNTSTQKSDADNTIKEVDSLAQKNFDWLLGTWEQTDEDPGKETFEEWSKSNDSGYIADLVILCKKATPFGRKKCY